MEFSTFTATHLPGLARYAAVLTGDRETAEDVLSDALIKAFNDWSRIRTMEHPLAYVRRIVATTFLSNRRLVARRKTVPYSPAALPEHPTEQNNDVEHRDELHRLLQSLPRNQLTAVVLRYYLDCPDVEIAAALGCSLSTVRSTISRALSNLRISMTEPKKV